MFSHPGIDNPRTALLHIIQVVINISPEDSFWSASCVQREYGAPDCQGKSSAGCPAGLLVFISVAGLAYDIQKIGFATGNFLPVLTQITTAVIIDAVGMGGFERNLITGLRLMGLAFMGLGAYTVLLN
ncbi:MAG: DMT family transporter [Anaerolineales bacterium]